MDDPRQPWTVIRTLTQLTTELQHESHLGEILQRVVDTAAGIMGVWRASVRLLDPTRTRLIAIARAGTPLHDNPNTEFPLGEGLLGWIAKHRLPIRSDHAQHDSRFVTRPGMKDPMRSFLGVPLLSGSACIGVLSVVSDQAAAFTEQQEEVLLLVAAISSPYVEIARLERLSTVDPLTGALNRRGLEDAQPEVVPPLAAVMIDVDHFKRVNDLFGHAIGDEVLRQLASLLAGVVRAGDAVVRYGGEEFLLLLPASTTAAAAAIAERARAAVHDTPFLFGGAEMQVTISAGVAQLRNDESRDDLIHRADEAMYAAKRGGRNRVERAA